METNRSAEKSMPDIDGMLHEALTDDLLRLHDRMVALVGEENMPLTIIPVIVGIHEDNTYMSLTRLSHEFTNNSSVFCILYGAAIQTGPRQIPEGSITKVLPDGKEVNVSLSGVMPSTRATVAQMQEICDMIEASITLYENGNAEHLLCNG